MFTAIKNLLVKVGIKMGIISDLNNLEEVKGINIPTDFYEHIRMWKQLHKGYSKEIHEVQGYSIGQGSFKRTMATLNIPKVVSQEMATLIFNERSQISISDQNYNQFIQRIFKENAFNSNFQQYLEFMFSQGGMVVKPYIDNGNIKIGYSTAENFIPVSWDNVSVKEAVFPSYITKNKDHYTLLEWHLFIDGVYTVRNELYISEDKNKLGTKTALSELFPNLEPEIRFNNVDRPLFTYFKPNTANNIDSSLPLGISIYANSMDTLKTIDTIFDSYLREFRLGRKRIIVPTSAIQSTPNANGTFNRYFDAYDETYEAMDVGGMDSDFMKEVNLTIRASEHIEGLNTALDTLALQIGFSPGAFSFQKSGLKTATEIVSENSKTFRTKKAHENIIEQGIADLIEAIGILATASGLYRAPSNYDVTVTFDDSIIVDKNAQLDNEIKAITAGIQSRVDAIMNYYGLTEEEAIQKLQRIMNEDIMSAPDMQTIADSITLGGSLE